MSTDQQALTSKMDEICNSMACIQAAQAKADVERGIILTALVGNDLGTTGVVKRLAGVETRVDAIERKHIKWAGIAVGISFVVGVLKDWIWGFFHKGA
jgi:hypothetical protein